MQKAVKLAASSASKKARLRGIVNEYATTVSGIPAAKRPEVWARLEALEKEASSS